MFLRIFLFLEVLCIFLLKSDKVNVFDKGEGGYFCIKIPDLLLTFNGTWLAFGEGRVESCSDHAWTDLVYKRSTDNGKTWSELQILRTNSSSNSNNVIGNAAPVQCNITKRILIPHCRNNREVWMMYSDDDGITWSTPQGPLNHLVNSNWSWVGLGPPAGMQLPSNNRIIVASYHSVTHIDGDVSKGHMIYSDDYGQNWNLSDGIFGISGNSDTLNLAPSESQAVQLKNGSLLINSRGTSEYRVGSISNDYGNTFEDSFHFNDLLDELTGCEGSMIKSMQSGYFYYSGITPTGIVEESLLRYNMTLYRSENQGETWKFMQIVNDWSSAYSALVSVEKQSDNKQDTIGILYERSEIIRAVFIPDHITFEIISIAT